MMHPIFDRFRAFNGLVDEGFTVDFIGSRTRARLEPEGRHFPARQVRSAPPPPDEEYFEWIDVLESVAGAKGSYTMIELGAGYGRWSARAACAVRQYSNIPYFLIAAEAEPSRFATLQTHMADNGIDRTCLRLFEAAVTDHRGEALFYVGAPEEMRLSVDNWFGQALAKDYEELGRVSEAPYQGRTVIEHKTGWRSVRTPCVTLEDVMEDVEAVDLIDMDVQGEELKIVSGSENILNERVKRLHIGTHGRELESGLRGKLGENGWRCIADYESQSEAETPFGRVRFVDGVQSWVNPRFESSGSG